MTPLTQTIYSYQDTAFYLSKSTRYSTCFRRPIGAWGCKDFNVKKSVTAVRLTTSMLSRQLLVPAEVRPQQQLEQSHLQNLRCKTHQRRLTHHP